MICFVDMRMADVPGRRFAFWCTVRNEFQEISGEQAWGALDEFREACELSPVADRAFVHRLEAQMPGWVATK